MSRDPRRPALPAVPERAPGMPRRRCAKRVGWRRGCASRRWKAAERTLLTVRVLGKSMTPRGDARDLPPVSRRPRLESAGMSLEAPTPGFEDTSPGCRARGRAGAQPPPSPIAGLGGRNAGFLVAPATEHRRRRRAWSRGGQGWGAVFA